MDLILTDVLSPVFDLDIPSTPGVDRTSPLSAVVASTEVDLDFTLSNSYNGSGTSVTNLSLDTNYDFTIQGTPTFTGTANDAAAYLGLDGSSFLEQNSSAGDLFALAASTSGAGSGARWYALAVQPVLNSTQAWQGNTDGNVARPGFRLLSNTSNNLRFAQRQGGVLSNIEIAPSGTLTNVPTIIIITFDSSNPGSEKYWVNNRIGSAWVNPYNPATGTSASNVPFQFASSFSTFSLPNATRLYGCYAGTGILSDSDAGLIIDQLNLRHNRIYA